MRFTAEIRRNPDHLSAAGWAFRSPDPANGYRASISLDGGFRLYLLINGNRTLLSERKLERPVRDSQRFAVEVALRLAEAAAIHSRLWDAKGGFFQRSVEQPVPGHEACSLALVTGLATPEQAVRLVGQLGWHQHGKFQSLMARGKLQYGHADAAMHDLFAHGWRRIRLKVGRVAVPVLLNPLEYRWQLRSICFNWAES